MTDSTTYKSVIPGQIERVARVTETAVCVTVTALTGIRGQGAGLMTAKDRSAKNRSAKHGSAKDRSAKDRSAKNRLAKNRSAAQASADRGASKAAVSGTDFPLSWKGKSLPGGQAFYFYSISSVYHAGIINTPNIFEPDGV